MINEANEPSSACRLWRIPQVETSTPPTGGHTIVPRASKFKVQSSAGTKWWRKGVAEDEARIVPALPHSITPKLQHSGPPYKTRGRQPPAPFERVSFSENRRGLVVHVAHAMASAVTGRSFFFLLRNLRDEAFGCQQQAGD